MGASRRRASRRRPAGPRLVAKGQVRSYITPIARALVREHRDSERSRARAGGPCGGEGRSRLAVRLDACKLAASDRADPDISDEVRALPDARSPSCLAGVIREAGGPLQLESGTRWSSSKATRPSGGRAVAMCGWPRSTRGHGFTRLHECGFLAPKCRPARSCLQAPRLANARRCCWSSDSKRFQPDWTPPGLYVYRQLRRVGCSMARSCNECVSGA